MLSSILPFINKFFFDLVNFNLYAVTFAVSSFIFFIVCITYLYLRFQKLQDSKISVLSYFINIGVSNFLKKISILFLIISIVIVFFIYKVFGNMMALSFFLGVFLSCFSVVIGLKSAHKGAGRTVLAAKSGEIKAFSITFISGVVSGFAFASLSLMGVSFLMYLINGNFDSINSVLSFAFSFTLIAFLIRAVGSIYSKSTDIISYLLQKRYKGNKTILNLSYVADNIGDNINNIASLGMDIVDSSITAIISAIILASIIPIVDISRYISVSVTRNSLVALPIIISLIGLLSSFIGIVSWFFLSKKNLVKILDIMNIVVYFMFFVGSFLSIYFLNYPLKLFIPVLCGGLLGFIISKFFEIYTKGSFITYILKYSTRGAAGNIMSGLYRAGLLVVFMLSLLIASIYISYTFSGIYGLSLASVGLIANFAFILTIGSSAPISDNAHSISVMSDQNLSINKITADLDLIGNTNASVTKTLSISASILTILALFIVYKQEVDFYYKSQLLMDITNMNILMGLLIGIAIVIAIVSYVIKSVDEMIDNMMDYYINKKFDEKCDKKHFLKSKFNFIKKLYIEKIKRFENLNSLSNKYYYFSVYNIKSFLSYFINKSIKSVLFPCIFIVCIVVTIFLMGSDLVVGIMLGVFLFGIGLSLLMYNSGELWDNAKKENYIQQMTKSNMSINKDDILTGDIVGDYFKDAIGPFVNIYIKLIFIIALLIVPLTKYRLF